MTEHEFQSDFLPVLAGIWPKMVARVKPGASEFDRKAVREANRNIFAVLGRYELQKAVQAARDYGADHPGSPSYNDYGKVLSGIRAALSGEKAVNRIEEAHQKALEYRIREAREAYEGSAGWEYPGDNVVRQALVTGEILPLQKHRLTVDYPEARRKLARSKFDGLGLGEPTDRDEEEECPF